MEIFKLDTEDKKILRRVQDKIVEMLESGGVVAVPTDTVYGLICDAFNEGAIQKIFYMKGRSDEKALPVFVSSLEEARKYAGPFDSAQGIYVENFLRKVWPGAVTVVLELRKYQSDINVRMFPQILTGGKNTIAMRMPNNEFLLEVLRRFGRPVAETSANISGKPAAKNTEEVLRYFGENPIQPDMVIDGGEAPGVSSTIVDLTGEELKVLREGAVVVE